MNRLYYALNCGKTTWDRLFWGFTLWMPSFYMFSETFNLQMGNRLILVYTILAIGYLHKQFLRVSKVRTLLGFDFALIIYLAYEVEIGGIGNILSSDFYCFVLMAVSFLIFSDREILEEFYYFYLEKEKKFLLRAGIMAFMLCYSVIYGSGLLSSFGSVIPVLYGPFSIPHVMGYIFIVVYCEATFFDRHNSHLIYKFIKIFCVIGCVWTAARSAVLGMGIVVLFDYLTIKQRSKKVVICAIAVVAVTALILTNSRILLNNPLIQKTIDAENTGSITSGREIYRAAASDYYLHSCNMWQKIIGIGMDQVRNVMYSAVRVRIHVHNEYYNALLGYGFIGLVIYIFIQLLPRKVIDKLLDFFACFGLVAVLAYYNGFAMYSLITISCPIIFIYFNRCNSCCQDIWQNLK